MSIASARKLIKETRPEFLRSQLIGDEVVFSTLQEGKWVKRLTLSKSDADKLR